MLLRFVVSAALMLGLAACQAPLNKTEPAPAPVAQVPEQPQVSQPSGKTIAIYKHSGARQCETGGPSLADRESELKAADIKVLSASCGSDGRMYASVCGGSSSHIYIFTIPAADWPKAQNAKFELLSKVPEARPFACN